MKLALLTSLVLLEGLFVGAATSQQGRNVKIQRKTTTHKQNMSPAEQAAQQARVQKEKEERQKRMMENDRQIRERWASSVRSSQPNAGRQATDPGRLTPPGTAARPVEATQKGGARQASSPFVESMQGLMKNEGFRKLSEQVASSLRSNMAGKEGGEAVQEGSRAAPPKFDMDALLKDPAVSQIADKMLGSMLAGRDKDGKAPEGLAQSVRRVTEDITQAMKGVPRRKEGEADTTNPYEELFKDSKLFEGFGDLFKGLGSGFQKPTQERSKQPPAGNPHKLGRNPYQSKYGQPPTSTGNSSDFSLTDGEAFDWNMFGQHDEV